MAYLRMALSYGDMRSKFVSEVPTVHEKSALGPWGGNCSGVGEWG